VNLLVYRPVVIPAYWYSSPTLSNIAATLHPKIIFDTEGGYARALGAGTSGEVILYSEAGRLLVQGGITPERGHEGASEGGTRLLKALQTGTVERYFSAVFGCPIFSRAGDLAR